MLKAALGFVKKSLMSNVIDSLNCGNATSNYFFDNGSKPSEPV
jgi:hypothetical protein